jgi:tetratricopeptide (TPR) repeat protein
LTGAEGPPSRKSRPLLVIINQALREGIDTKERLEAYVAKLRAGAQEFTDEAEGREKNLAASLSYGFGSAFSEEERRVLSLLYLFQVFVDVSALLVMGHPQVDWSIEAVRGWTGERLTALLDRAAEVGLLMAHGGGYYGIHPALPWFFRGLFTRFYPGAEGDRARRAFAQAIGELGSYWAEERYMKGDRAAARGNLAAEEDNLRAAWALARDKGLWNVVIKTMQSLRELYRDTGRNSAWRRLIEAVAPDFVDPAGDGPVPGREVWWSNITEYRVDLLQNDRNWSEAQRLQQLKVDWARRVAAPILEASPETWDVEQRHHIRRLGASLERLGRIRREPQDEGCIADLEEALALYRRLGLGPEEAMCAFNLGNAYLEVTPVRNLDTAEHWYRRSLALRPPSDDLGRARSLGQLGFVALKRLEQARWPAEFLVHLNAAGDHCRRSLDLLPSTAARELSIAHDMLGKVSHYAGKVDSALNHLQHSIRYAEASGDLYSAGHSRHNAALMLLEAGRLPDARDYAAAAVANFRVFGHRATDACRQAEKLLAAIDVQIERGGRQ